MEFNMLQSKLTGQDKKYRAQDDARMLMCVEEIKKDKSRQTMAIKELKNMAKEHETKAKVAKTIATKNTTRSSSKRKK
jgi:hypothetical protein